MTKNPSFSPFVISNGMLFDNIENKYPTRLYSYSNNEQSYFDKEDSTHYIYVYKGLSSISIPSTGEFYALKEGMYASINRPFSIVGGQGIVVEKLGYQGMFNIGGPVEAKGRLAYIDGCTDTLLLSPPRLGDPCFNLLHFPNNIKQTQHTHPSMRVGIVAKGSGLCLTPFGNIPLTPGCVFIIHEETEPSQLAIGEDGLQHIVGTHSFETFEEEMVVIAYHPDSDFGPTDENHPMINRTIVEGISASNIESIRTKI